MEGNARLREGVIVELKTLQEARRTVVRLNGLHQVRIAVRQVCVHACARMTNVHTFNIEDEGNSNGSGPSQILTWHPPLACKTPGRHLEHSKPGSPECESKSEKPPYAPPTTRTRSHSHVVPRNLLTTYDAPLSL